MRRLATAAFVLALGASFPHRALANGRFPSADQLIPDPGDPQHLVLRATFGLLQSHDGGQTFHWVCEDAIGYSGDRDPALAVTADGSVLAGFARDLRVSAADGCSWSSPFAGVDLQNFLDATIDPSAPSNALFVAHSLGTDHQVQVFLTEQSATSLEPLGPALGDDFSPLTLEVAPSRPARIYVTGIAEDLSSVLLRSDDRGQSWERSAIEPDSSLPAYIAAVDPQNPDRLYLRVDGASSDALLVSDDGGKHFSEAFTIQSDMLGFALSPDGTRIVLGGPDVGQFVADAQDLSFSAASGSVLGLTCLKWTTDLGLMACAREVNAGFTVGQSNDAGQTFVPVFHLAALTPLSCDSGTDSANSCPSVWPGVAKTLGIASDAPESTAVPTANGGGCALSARDAGGSGAALLAGFAAVLARIARRRRHRRAGASGAAADVIDDGDFVGARAQLAASRADAADR